MTTFRVASVLAVVLLVMAGCGGGGGDPGSPATPPSAAVRDVPGYRLTVACDEALVPGATVTLRIRVQCTAGDIDPAAVQTWIQAGYEESATVVDASAVAGDPGAFTAVVTLPPSIGPETAAWIRLEMPDGSRLEAGHDAFFVSDL